MSVPAAYYCHPGGLRITYLLAGKWHGRSGYFNKTISSNPGFFRFAALLLRCCYLDFSLCKGLNIKDYFVWRVDFTGFFLHVLNVNECSFLCGKLFDGGNNFFIKTFTSDCGIFAPEYVDYIHNNRFQRASRFFALALQNNLSSGTSQDEKSASKKKDSLTSIGVAGFFVSVCSYLGLRKAANRLLERAGRFWYLLLCRCAKACVNCKASIALPDMQHLCFTVYHFTKRKSFNNNILIGFSGFLTAKMIEVVARKEA